jgi:predicted nucleic acid-binding protein
MITAVDTNVLVDVLVGDPTFGSASREALRAATRSGALIVSDVVWAETSVTFTSEEDVAQAFDDLRITLVPLDARAAYAAGAAWSAHRRRGGRRDRVIADFLVGAHAATHADVLLTRDYGFYRSRFRGLKILDPTAG